MTRASELLEKMNQAFINALDRVTTTKALKFTDTDAVTKAELDKIAQRSKTKVDELPVFTDKQVYGKSISKGDSPAALDFEPQHPLPAVFMLTTSFGKFIVSTGGYDYARMIAKVA